MIPHLHKHTPRPRQPALATVRRFPNRKWFLIPLAGIALALSLVSCEPSAPPKPPAVPVTDTAPVGEGLKVIGYAMLGAACVIVLGRLIRS